MRRSKKTHRHYDRQRKCRVDGRSDSVCQRSGRLCRNDAVERLARSTIFGFDLRRNRDSYDGKEGESPSLIKRRKTARCKSENHVPMVAVSEESLIPDDPSNAPRDRWHIPGGSASGDWSRKVVESDVPSQENLGQASGDREHVQSPGDWSHKVPEWLLLFNEGVSGDFPTHTMSWSSSL